VLDGLIAPLGDDKFNAVVREVGELQERPSERSNAQFGRVKEVAYKKI